MADLDVRVIPRARKTELAGMREGAVLVRLAAQPVEGAANEALVAFLAERLGLPRRNIHLVSGARSRRKRLAIDGMTSEQIAAALGA